MRHFKFAIDAMISAANLSRAANYSLDMMGGDTVEHPRQLLEFFHSCTKRLEFSSTIRKKTQPHAGFDRILEILSDPDATLPISTAVEIAKIADAIMGNYTAGVNSSTVARHFRRSSSFGGKSRLLFNIVRAARPTACLELGTAYGISGCLIMRAQEAAGVRPKLRTVEAYSPQKEISADILKNRFHDAVDTRHGTKQDVISKIVAGTDTFDLLFHDAGHSGDAYVTDFTALIPALQPGAIVILDDIRWKSGKTTRSRLTCYRGWREILKHDRVVAACEVNHNLGILALA